MRGDTVLENWSEAERNLRALSSLGINLESITDALQADGLRSFASAYDRVLDAIAKKHQKPSIVPLCALATRFIFVGKGLISFID